MSIAKLRKAAAPGGLWTRWAWGCLLAASSSLAGAGCDQRNLAVISLDGLPSSATAITAYYSLDGTAWKSVVPQRSLQQFGIELPQGRSVTLETQIFSYTNNIPCSLGNAAGAADLDGGSIRELELSVTTTTDHCQAATEPADFPPGKMVVWANAADDIWLAGTGGKVVHWDGFVYTSVPLPAELVQTPPDWNAILGDGPDIWLAGTNSAVAHWIDSQRQLSVVKIAPPAVGPTDWRSMAMADYSAGTIILAGSNRVIGVTSSTVQGVGEVAFNCGAVTPPGALTAVGCPFNGTNLRCFFVTDGGGIASLQSTAGGMPPCKNIPSPTTTGLLDVFVGVNLASQAYDVHIVGKSGVALRATTPILGTADPNFKAANTDYSSFIPQNARVDLNRIFGSSLDDLWIAGQGGLVLRWKNTTAGMPPGSPFSQSPTGTTADLSSLSDFSGHLFFSGASHTLGYIGTLFTPTSN